MVIVAVLVGIVGSAMQYTQSVARQAHRERANVSAQAIGDACRDALPGAAVLPRVMAGFTDSRTFRRHGVPCYGFVPMLFTSQEMAGMHGC